MNVYKMYYHTRMVAVISFLTVLRMLSNAQTSCNRGIGRFAFEKLLDTELQGFDDDVYRERAPPLQVLARCKELCLSDRNAQEGVTRTCSSFDFIPGRRTSLFTGAGSGNIDFEESSCFLSREQGRPEGIGTLTTNKYHIHFNEVCLSSSRVSTECSERIYAFERLEGFRFDQREGQEIYVKNRTDCEDRCLNEYGFICRSASYDMTTQRCFLSRRNRRTNPDSLQTDSSSVYLENVCLDEARRCEGFPLFIREMNTEFTGPFGLEVVTATSEADCERQCLQHRRLFCRSIQYDGRSHNCILSDEDSVSQPKDLRSVPGSSTTYAEIMCANVNVGTASTPPIIGSFERIRNQHLTTSEYGADLSSRSLGECLEECLRQGPAQCMSLLYSSRTKTCRLSQRLRNDVGARLEFDQDFDYFEAVLGSNLDRGSGFGGYGSGSNPVGSGTSYPFGTNYGPVPAYGSGPGIPGQSPPGGGPNVVAPSLPGAGPGGYGSGSGAPFGGSSWNTGGQWYNNGQPPLPGGNTFNSGPVPNGGLYPQGSNGGIGPSPNLGSFGQGGPGGIGPSPNMGSYGQGGPGGIGSPDPFPNSNIKPGSQPSGGSSFSASNFYGDYAPGRGSLIPGPPPPPLPPPNVNYGPGQNIGEQFTLIGPRQRIRYFYIRRVTTVNSLKDCEKECLAAKDFCRSFNFRNFFQENCELSDQDTSTLDLTNPSYFDRNSEFDYYEKRKSAAGYPGLLYPYSPPNYQGALVPAYPVPVGIPGPLPAAGSLVPPGALPAPAIVPAFPVFPPGGGYPYPGQLDVKQVCSEDGIEFTLTTPEGFYGRIYSYGYYDTCFFDGRGETISVLKVSRPDGFPRCGTVGYADYFTNIVVVQFNDFVQTGRDRKYNLTCTLYGPGETVVTSGVLNTGSVPIPLENLPAQNILASNVLLKIMYKGYPVQQIAVGDPLIFRLETRRSYGYGADIFATNVLAKDPYSGRVVQLIDPIGCPVDWYIFPNLDRARDGDGLEAQFNAFKIPDSNFLVFEATVKTCRGPCQPINCNSPGRYNVDSLGRKRREILGNTTDDTFADDDDDVEDISDEILYSNSTILLNDTYDSNPEQVRELLQVYLTRADMPVNSPGVEVLDVCISSGEYYALVVVIGISVIVLIVIAIVSAACIRRYKLLHSKNITTHSTSSIDQCPSTEKLQFHPSFYGLNAKFDDPSEPIYTDPSLFERSTCLGSNTKDN